MEHETVNKEPQVEQQAEQKVQELTKLPTVPQSSFCLTPDSRRERTLPTKTPSVSKPSCNRKQKKLQDNLIPTEHTSVPHLSQDQNTDFQHEESLPSRQSPVPHSSQYQHPGFQPERKFPSRQPSVPHSSQYHYPGFRHGREFTSRQLPVPHSPHCQHPRCQHSSGSMTPDAHHHLHLPNNPITVPLPSYTKTQGHHHDKQQHTNQTSLQWSSYHQEPQDVQQEVVQVLTKQPSVPQSAFCLTPDSRRERTLPTKTPSVSKPSCNRKPKNLHDSRIPTEWTCVPHSSHYASSDFQHMETFLSRTPGFLSSHYQHPSCQQSPNHTKPDAHHRMKPDAHHRKKPDSHHHTHLPNGQCFAYKELSANQPLDLSSSDNQTLNVESRLRASQPSTSRSSSNQLPNDLHYNSVFNQQGVNYYNMGPNAQFKDHLSAQNFKVQESSAFQNYGELTVHQLSKLYSRNQEPSIQPHGQMSLSTFNSGELLDQTHNRFQIHTQGIQPLIPMQLAEYRRIKKFQSELPYSVIGYQRRGMPHNLPINSNETKAQSCNNVPATGSREGSDAEVGVPAADAIINKRRRISRNAQKAFQCPYCYKSYTTKYWLDRHVVRSHQFQPGSV